MKPFRFHRPLNRLFMNWATLGAAAAVTYGAFALAPLVIGDVTAEASTPVQGEGCYLISPAGSVHENDDHPSERETWCYRSVPGSAGVTFVYNADGATVKPEMSALIDGSGLLKHASLLAGELTVHQVNTNQFNPFPAPLQIPADAERVTDGSVSHLEQSAQDVMKFLVSARGINEDMTFAEYEYATASGRAKMPWRGYWWPYSSSRLSTGSGSPLAKYDRFVRANGGDSSAQAWEKKYHQYSGIKWEGHCNGWAASSVLRAEPRRSRYDRKSRVTFTVSDIKGLLAEKDSCVKYSFFGQRYRGRAGDDLRDIHPAEFHNTISYYLGRLKKPLVMDHFQSKGIDNHVISAFKSSMKKISANTYSVTTVLTVHRYDKSPVSKPGSAPSYKRTLQYTLRRGSSGSYTGGSWKTKNPDFLWVPLSTIDCKRKNSHVTDEWIDRILDL